jgi:hypothetical protein
MNAILRCTLATLVVAVGLTSTNQAMASAQAKLISGELIVVDKADFFSNDAIKQAKADFALLQSANERRVVIHTINALPDDAKADFAKRSGVKEKRDFWRQFAIEQAKTDKNADVFILICRSPGHVQVIADETMRKGGFVDKEEEDIAKIFIDKFNETKGKPPKETMALHDAALLAAVKELRLNLPITLAKSHNQAQGHAAGHQSTTAPAKEGMGIMGYVCIGLAILAGVWLIFGVIRAFTGGGGGGGYGGGMGGGGMGGGGFMSSLMGGLFGSMAGMWLYDNLLGGHTSSAFGGNAGVDNNYDGGSGPADEPGRGDFSGDQGAGGDFDDGSGGDTGGDFGGGGGDFGGGGGDFGGGGGDFGGGGGDF